MTVEFLQSRLLAAAGVRHGFTQRCGGISAPPYDSLNLALHVGDDAAAVCENRRLAAAAFGFASDRLTCAQQVHGSRVAVISAADAGRGALSWETAMPECDAMITRVSDAALAVLVADCAPVLLYDPRRRVAGAVHCGWRGTLAGTVVEAVAAMCNHYGTRPGDVVAAIGPCLHACCLEVGPEVEAAFHAADPGYAAYFPQFSRPHLDLVAVLQYQLIRAGVAHDRIEAVPDCTQCHGDRFFSYRGAGGITGRQAGIICLGQKT